MDEATDYMQTSLGLSARVKERRSFDRKKSLPNEVEDHESSENSLVKDGSIFSRDVEQWIHGSPTEAGIQATSHPPHPVTERSMTTVQSSVAGFWHIMAIALPLLNNNVNYLTFPLRTVLDTAESLYSYFGRVYDRILCRLVQFVEGPAFNDIVTVVMDLVLVIYAFGFVVLSMYETAVIG